MLCYSNILKKVAWIHVAHFHNILLNMKIYQRKMYDFLLTQPNGILFYQE